MKTHKYKFMLNPSKCKDCNRVIAPVKSNDARVYLCEVEPVAFSYEGAGKRSEFIDRAGNKVNGYKDSDSKLMFLKIHQCHKREREREREQTELLFDITLIPTKKS